jgi:hypothetical protein
MSTETIHIPESELLALSKYSSSIDRFLSKIREYDESADFELGLQSETSVEFIVRSMSTDIVICKGTAHLLGSYGAFSPPSEEKEEKETIVIHHWIWPWIDGPMNHDIPKSERNKISDLFERCADAPMQSKIKDIPELTTLTKGSFICVEDPMLISYIQAVLMDKLTFDTIYNIGITEDTFLCFGVDNLKWVTQEEIQKAWELDQLVVEETTDILDELTDITA